jgi:hypothetical protein
VLGQRESLLRRIRNCRGPITSEPIRTDFPVDYLARLLLYERCAPTADEPACCRSTALCSNRPLLPKRFCSQNPRYGSARAAIDSCISSNGSRSHNSSSLNERRYTCLTPPSWQSNAALTVCFAACSWKCVSGPNTALSSTERCVPQRFPHLLRLVAENFHSTLQLSSDCLGTSQRMKNPEPPASSPAAPEPSFKPLYPTCSALAPSTTHA